MPSPEHPAAPLLEPKVERSFRWGTFLATIAIGLAIAGGVWWWLGRHPKASAYHPAISKTWRIAGPLVATPATFGNGRQARTVWISQRGVLTLIPHDGGNVFAQARGESNGTDGPLGVLPSQGADLPAVTWGTREGRLLTFDGSLFAQRTNTPAMGSIQAEPVEVSIGKEPRLLAADLKGNIIALPRNGQGSPVWRRENLLVSGDGFFATPRVSQDRVLFVSRLGSVLCLEIATGRTLWKTQLKGTFKASPTGAPESHPPSALLANLEGDLFHLDLREGRLLKTLKVEAGSVASPLRLAREKKWVVATHSGPLLWVADDVSQVLSRQVLAPGDGFRASPIAVDGDHHGGRLVAVITGQGRLGLFDGENFSLAGDVLSFDGDVTATPLAGDFDGDGRTDLWISLESGHVLLVGLFPQGARPGTPYLLQTPSFSGREGSKSAFLR